jgi:hypothetical protein
MLGVVKNAVMVHLPIAEGRTYADMGYIPLKLKKEYMQRLKSAKANK